MMMTLGLFVFMLKTVPFQQLQLQRQWRHASNNRMGLRPSLQFLGPDSDVITSSGVLMPAITGGRLSMQMLERMAKPARAGRC
jgi:phage protein U